MMECTQKAGHQVSGVKLLTYNKKGTQNEKAESI